MIKTTVIPKSFFIDAMDVTSGNTSWMVFTMLEEGILGFYGGGCTACGRLVRKGCKSFLKNGDEVCMCMASSFKSCKEFSYLIVIIIVIGILVPVPMYVSENSTLEYSRRMC
jgi:uncharacterized membrane protein